MKNIQHISLALTDYIKDITYSFQNGDKPRGLSTGIKELDKKLGGLQGGNVILIAGRPAMGKTAFTLNCVYRVAKQFAEEENPKKHILYLSAVSSNKYITQRLLHLVSKFSIYNSFEDSKQIKHITWVANQIENLPIYLWDTIYSLDDISNTIYQFANKNKLGLIIVDYLQIFSLYKQQEKEGEIYRNIMKNLKNIAEKLDIPIIVISQVSSNVENRQYKIPTISDIRGTYEDIVPYADKILFIYRESYYMYEKKPQRYKRETMEHFNQRYTNWKKEYSYLQNKCQFIIAKNSDGPISSVECLFTDTGEFINCEEDITC